ncbi:MAG: hypothetical protein LQ342_001256 [Letrouitia transgressa]|nr:MAG: hypothetical protein LQ342_001256 [Letrouitia transgressa]
MHISQGSITDFNYLQIPGSDQENDPTSPKTNHDTQSIPSSPPPSFRSRASSQSSRRLLSDDPITTEADRTLADTFDDGSASDSDGNEGSDDRQRLMRGNIPVTSGQTIVTEGSRPVPIQRTVTEFPGVLPSPARTRGTPYSTFATSNDGVFANLSAKPERGEKDEEEKPPSYEAAAADATPPYWETTILAPGLSSPDEVYVDGLPVGSLFSFVWNGMISMSFQFVGFLLTYLLHTTHAAKNGSRAGLGITLIQYGFYMRSGPSPKAGSGDGGAGKDMTQPADPNSIDFDPNSVSDNAAAVASAAMAANGQGGASSSSSSTFASIASSEWLAYVLMIIGWFILIRAVSDFFKARRHEQLVLRSPERGLNVPVVAEGERVETVV